MLKDKEIIYLTAECLEHSINILKDSSSQHGWEDNKEYIRQVYILSTIGYVLTHDEYKDELILFFKILGNKLKENADIIKEAKKYANITKRKK
tara:strand:+ start:2344 stop:2622 length:279 start_codon:yes stop_codon:yes gene_type:complete